MLVDAAKEEVDVVRSRRVRVRVREGRVVFSGGCIADVNVRDWCAERRRGRGS